MTFQINNCLNKFFFHGSSCYKVTRETAKTIFYMRCEFDRVLDLDTGVIWMSVDSIHHRHFLPIVYGPEEKHIKKKVEGRLQFYDDISNLYIKSSIVKDDYLVSSFYLQGSNLKLASKLQYYLLSLDVLQDRMNSTDVRVPIIYREFMDNTKEILKNPNLDAIKHLLKHEILNGDDLRMNKLIEIINKHNLNQETRALECLNDECPVCLEIKDINKGYYKCNHSFCETCYQGWCKNSLKCPLCRSE